MAKYQVEINGQKYELEAPDETALKAAIGKLQGGALTEDTPAEPDWKAQMRQKAKEASDHSRRPISEQLGDLDDSVRAFGRGVLGVGSYLDEADAAFNATLAPVVDPLLPDSFEKLPQDTWQGRYDKALEIQRGKDKAFDESRPGASTALKIGGGLMSAGALLNKVPAAANFILGNMGKSTLGKFGASVGAGIGTGLVQGYGAGEDDAETRVKRALMEGAIGGGVGAMVLPASAAIKQGVRRAHDYFTSKTVRDALSGINKSALRYVEDNLSDPAKVAATKADLDKLGPEAMLADVSPDWAGVAHGSATRPGVRDDIINPLTDRHKLANTRLGEDVRQSLGPDPIPSQVNAQLEASRAEVQRLYGPALAERTPYDFTPITADLDRQIGNLRGDAQRALQRVRAMMNDEGVDEVTNDPAVAFQVRQAIDGMLQGEQNTKVIGALSDARQMVDDALRQSVPRIKEIDAQYHELSRQMEGLQRGRPILSNEASAMRPSELDQEMIAGGDPHGNLIGPSAESMRSRQGVLGEIYRAIGTKANDTTALRNIVRGDGDWNRAKLASQFGEENADRALDAIDRESLFNETYNRVKYGSDTAVKKRFGDALDEAAKPMDIPASATLTGGGAKAGQWLLRKALAANAEDAGARFAQDIGRLSVAKGDQRDAIVRALMTRGDRVQRINDPKMQELIAALLRTGGQSTYPSLPGVRE